MQFILLKIGDLTIRKNHSPGSTPMWQDEPVKFSPLQKQQEKLISFNYLDGEREMEKDGDIDKWRDLNFPQKPTKKLPKFSILYVLFSIDKLCIQFGRKIARKVFAALEIKLNIFPKLFSFYLSRTINIFSCLQPLTKADFMFMLQWMRA